MRALGRFALADIDALLVILVAFGVLAAEIVGDPKKELVDSAILGLLGVTAIVLLRDRSQRVDPGELRQLARDGAKAVFSLEKSIRAETCSARSCRQPFPEESLEMERKTSRATR